MRMRTVAAVLLVPVVLAAQQAVLPLRLLFVGESDQAGRSAEFAAFLGQRFTAVSTTTHGGFERAQLDGVDVVLLDWHQNGQAERAPCPLGDFAGWNKPMVLLGSAGLNLAIAWDVFGGVG